MDENMTADHEKWEKYADSVNTNTSSKKVAFELTVKNCLDLLGENKNGRLLDIGCGLGEIDILLASRTDFDITACDISQKCVEKASENAKSFGINNRVKYEVADVYALPYKDEEFDVVVSFGYTSAATYKGAQNEVARVLKPGGLFVCDFVNPLSFYKIHQLPKRWNKFRKEEGKYYNILTASSIEKYFSKYSLYFVSQKFFNVYPPLDFIPARWLIFFEQIFGMFLSKPLGRVRLVCFQKR